jgi:fatty-acyl-CoA synthase
MPMATVAGLVRARAADEAPGLSFEGRTWSWREVVAECSLRAAWLHSLRTADPGRPVHVGVLLDNVPELVFLLGGAALSGSVIVALNTSRAPAELAGDAERADCDLIVTEPRHLDPALQSVRDADLGVIDIESAGWTKALEGLAHVPDAEVDDQTLLMLIFTSGTSGNPRAVRITHRKVTVPGENLAGRLVSASDVVYSPMPLFHSGAIMAAFAPALTAGAHLVIRRKFSASGLLTDVAEYGCTYLHYVGKALSYVLAAVPEPVENTLKVAFGNEAAPLEQKAFGERLGCFVLDAYGSSETAISLSPDPFGPPGTLGKLGEGIKILDPETGAECPVGVVGELVNTEGMGLFDGYYNEVAEDRLKGGMYWSGDFAYRDENGYAFFTGRSLDRLRVDGENFTAVQVERAIGGVTAYGVPDVAAGDQVMVAVVGDFDPVEFALRMRGLNPRWVPRYVRVATELPTTASNKIVKRVLAAEGWHTSDPIWYLPSRHRPGRDPNYRLMTPTDVAALHTAFEHSGRLHLLERRQS